jgi:tetratricopeptide (TPR) repeat protein
LIISFKNLFIGIILSSLIAGQDLKDIDIKLTNLEFDKAQASLEQLYNKYPENTDVLLRLSITHHYLSESAMKKSLDKKNALKAFEYIEKAFNIEPDNPDILKWYVITLGKTVEEDTIRNQIEQSKNIKNIALKVIDLLPDDEFCYSIMGQWHYKLADLGRASRRIASILFSEPPKGSFEEAQYFFEKSLERNSDYIGTYYWLGKTYLKLNNEQKAIELFKLGVTLDRPFKREERAYQGMKSYLEKL